MTDVTIRPARPGDEHRIWELIGELAAYEKLEHLVTGSPETLHEHLFGNPARAEAYVAETDQIVGYVLFFTTYSTFRTQPGVWMEDLYVTPGYRGQGIGKKLLLEVTRQVHERGWGRHEWSVLDWNENAINFYQSLGAHINPSWRQCRLEDDSLTTLVQTT